MKKKRTSRHWKTKPGEYKDYLLQRNFGISLVDYNILLDAQGGACAICGKLNNTDSHNGERMKSLGVDHCHTTGVVRGLLCNNCNRAIGQLQDSSEILRKAADYLDFHKKLFKKACSNVDTLLEDLLK